MPFLGTPGISSRTISTEIGGIRDPEQKCDDSDHSVVEINKNVVENDFKRLVVT